MEHQVREGGFALITGDPGTGKSVALRLLAHDLSMLPDVDIGVLARPQSGLGDCYRELRQLDQKLYLEAYTQQPRAKSRTVEGAATKA
jgi:dephospho-CoA kinase